MYLYAQEYISYGASDVGLVTTRPTGRKEYKLADHLGSTRAVLDEQGAVIGIYDLAPFGEVIATTGVKSRKGFIDKETDQETATGNFGVRQYKAEEGRFTSVDPLWEQYRSQTPYHYSSNTPLVIKDPSGLAGNPTKDRPSDAPVDCGGGGGSNSPWNTTLGPRSPNTPVGVGYTPRSGGGGKAGSGTTSRAGGKKGAKGDYRPTDAEGNPTPLPKDKAGNLVPDSPNPHTQIGTRSKSKREGPYKQAIEFDKDGKPVKRIDFSDHTTPNIHPNPHQHPANPSNAGTPVSSIGGTFKWGQPQPLTSGPD